MDSPKQKLEKGKAPVKTSNAEDSTKAIAPSLQDGSLSSRVLASATGLAKQVLTPDRNITSQLSSRVPGSSKGSSSTQERGETSRLFESTLSGSASSHVGQHDEGGFRSGGHGGKWSDEQFDAFFAGEQPAFEPTGSVGDPLLNENWTAEFQTSSTGVGGMPVPLREQGSHDSSITHSNHHNLASEATQSHHQFPYSTSQAEFEDGAEVRALLDDPDFVAHADVYDFGDSTVPPEDLFSQDFSEHERLAVSKIRADLPPPPTHNLSKSNRSELSLFYPTYESHEEQALFASDEQRSHFLDQWSNVIDSYVDDVWGEELLPVVREVREQLEKAKMTGKGSLDPKALARLKMVLGHISEQHPFQYMDTQTNLRSPQDFTTTQNTFAGQHQSEATQSHSHSQNDHIYHQTAKISKDQSQDEDNGVGRFQCPWISCQESFDNMNDLSRHSITHESTASYPCPHTSCTESFSSRGEWAKHIKVAHHEATDTPLMATTVDKESLSK